MVVAVFAEHPIDSAGPQEMQAGRVNDLQTLLPGYGWIGVGRGDGRAAGEFGPIFYARQVFGGTQKFNEFQTLGPAKIIDDTFVGPGILVQTHGYHPMIKDEVSSPATGRWAVASRSQADSSFTPEIDRRKIV